MRLVFVLVALSLPRLVAGDGDPTPAPSKQNLDAAERGCRQGNAASCTRAGDLHVQAWFSGSQEDGGTHQAKLALERYQRACDLHDAAGCTGVAWWLLDGRPTRESYARAMALLEDACRTKHMPACTMIADQLEPTNGRARDGGIAEDLARAIQLNEAACAVATNEGCTSGCNSLGRLYYYGAAYAKPKVPKDLARAAQYYDRACAVGCINSCDTLGDMLRDGDGIAPDAKRAATLYQKACDAPFSVSCASLAALYAAGTGVAKDAAKAKRLHARACKLSRNQVGGCAQ